MYMLVSAIQCIALRWAVVKGYDTSQHKFVTNKVSLPGTKFTKCEKLFLPGKSCRTCGLYNSAYNNNAAFDAMRQGDLVFRATQYTYSDDCTTARLTMLIMLI